MEIKTMVAEMKNSIGRLELKSEKISQKVKGRIQRDGRQERKDKKIKRPVHSSDTQITGTQRTGVTEGRKA